LLLEAGVDVNTRGGSSGEPPLHTAANWGQLDMISLLIANGADPNMPDNAGWTPVRLVLRHLPERQMVVALLRKYGARD
jgi:ankyrin repeat protein